MKHLNEEQLQILKLENTLDEETKAHYDACLFCQSEFKSLVEFDDLIINSMNQSESNQIDIRQNVFNELNIDFKVESKNDNFQNIALILFIGILSVLLYFYPISIDASPLYNWIPTDQIASTLEKYKMLFTGAFMFGVLFAVDRFKQTLKERVS